ncbi:MAG: helix-turn-helix domain-containing protein [Acidocella sp.]|nr:helix-turn-helix domain-containing protein [Acidocella sp.]
MTKRYEVKKIKSAQRVLEVLEYFTPDRHHATVMDIARSMGYPQSSTSELLSCLVSLGYLHCDRRARVYWPTARVALLGAWVNPTLFRQGNLLPMMDRLAERTGAAVVLSSKVDIWSQCVHVVGASLQPDAPVTGSRAILTQSPSGKLLLSTLEAEHARKLIHRINAEVEPEMRAPVDQLLADIREVGARKVVGGTDTDGGGVIAMLLPQASGVEPMTVGLHCASATLASHVGEYIQILKQTVTGKSDWTYAPENVNDASQADVTTLAA